MKDRMAQFVELIALPYSYPLIYQHEYVSARDELESIKLDEINTNPRVGKIKQIMQEREARRSLIGDGRSFG